MSNATSENTMNTVITMAAVALAVSIITFIAFVFCESEQIARKTLIKDVESSHCQITKEGLLCQEVSERTWLETI